MNHNHAQLKRDNSDLIDLVFQKIKAELPKNIKQEEIETISVNLHSLLVLTAKL